MKSLPLPEERGQKHPLKALLDLLYRFFQLLHELVRRPTNGLAVSEQFYRIHAPLTSLATRYEEGCFLHRFGDLALIEPRLSTGLT